MTTTTKQLTKKGWTLKHVSGKSLIFTRAAVVLMILSFAACSTQYAGTKKAYCTKCTSHRADVGTGLWK